MSDGCTHGGSSPCCPLPPGVAPLEVGPVVDDDLGLARLARWAHALSDPNRLRMLDLMVKAQGCCRPGVAGGDDRPGGEPGAGRPASPAGVCVCELQSLHGLAQSKVSYHVRVLRDAGLVREERRGKWSFYAIDEAVAAECAAAVRRQLGR